MLNTTLLNRRRTGAQAASRRPIRLQPLMAPERDLAAVRSVLDAVGHRLNVFFELQAGAGEIVLLDGALLPHLTLQQLEAFREDRPAVTLPSVLDQAALDTDDGVQASLLQQFEALEIVDRRGQAALGASAWRTGTSLSLSGVPEMTAFCPPPGALAAGLAPQLQMAPEQSARAIGEDAFIAEVFAALDAVDAGDIPTAKGWGYGPRANLFFDFRRRQVVCDPVALQRLRLRFELPQLTAREGPRFDASRRSMDELLWDLGMASTALPLRGAPANWLEADFVYLHRSELKVLTRQPSHLEAVRRLQAGPTTPAALRRSMRLSALELKQLMQALCFLGRIRWVAYVGSQIKMVKAPSRESKH